MEYLSKKYLEITYLYHRKLSEIVSECTLAYYNGFNVIILRHGEVGLTHMPLKHTLVSSNLTVAAKYKIKSKERKVKTMTKSELIEALTNYSDGTKIKDDIIIRIGVNMHSYDITDINCIIDMDTNTGYIALSNKENEEKYRESRWGKLYK